MPSLENDMAEFRNQLTKGSIQRAYGALHRYLVELRTHFAKSHGASAVSGLYQGCMDMAFFTLAPPPLKRRDLKVAVVFNFAAFRFEAWLAGRNRKVQRQCWEIIRDSHWTEYPLVEPGPGRDAIVECVLAEDFDLDARDALTSRIEKTVAAFIQNVERFLSEYDAG